MKDRKTLNKIFTAVTILCTSIVLLYGFGVALITGNEENPGFMAGIEWAVAGPILFFAILALGATIAKMVLVTVPTFKAGTNKPLAITALVMDVVVLVGFVFIMLALIGASLDIPETEWLSRDMTLLTLVLMGVPFMFVGGILSGKLQKAALKPAK